MKKIKAEIIKLLTENAKYTSKQIATILGADATEVDKCVKEMENDGTIVKYTTIINNEIASNGIVQAMIEVKVAPQKLNGFDSYAEELYNFPEVTSLYLMSGGFDLAVFVDCKSLNEVAKFIAEKLSVIDGVTGVKTHFILKKYKIEGQITHLKEEVKRQIVQA